MKTAITTEQAVELFDLPEVMLYVCDGKVPACAKTFCHYNGTGDCRHTTDESHALYEVHYVNEFERRPAVRDGEAAVICVEPIRGDAL